MFEVQSSQWQAFFADPSEANFLPVYEATRASVYTLCFRVLRRQEDAEDAFQAAYIRLFLLAKKRDQTAMSEDPFSCLGQLAIREADKLRKQRERKAKKEKTMAEPPDAHDPSALPNQIAADRQFRDQVQALTAQLPERERLALELHFFNGMSQREIARLLGLSQGAVSQRIRKGIDRLRPMMLKAGLGEAVTVGTALAATGALVNSSASAAAIFTQAQSLAATAMIGTTVSKTLIGVASMKIKATVAAAVIATLLAGVVVVQYRSWQEKYETQSAAVSSTIALSAPASSPTVATAMPASGPASEGNIDKSSVQLETLVSAERPSTHTLQLHVRVIWKDSRKEVEGATVALVQKYPPTARDITVKTDAKGEALLPYASDTIEEWIEVRHPDAGDCGRLVDLPLYGVAQFELRPSATVFGKAWIAEEGKAAANAEVILTSSDRIERIYTRARKTTADSEGRFEFRNVGFAKATLRARLGDKVYPLRPREIDPMKILSGVPNGPVMLMLEKGGTIRGIVRDVETNQPIANATVESGGRKAATGADGTYVLSGFPLSQQNLTASAAAHAARDAKVNVPADGNATQNFDLDPAIEVDVLVVDENNTPVPGAMIQALNIQERFNVVRIARGKTNEQGIAHLPNISRIKLPALSAEKIGYDHLNSSEITIDPQTGRGASRITMKSVPDMWRVIAGTVTNAQGQPIQAAQVQWMPTDMTGARSERVLSDKDGRYRIEAFYEIPQCRLGFSAQGYASQYIENITAGNLQRPRELNITLQSGHWLEGMVKDEQDNPVAGAVLSAVPSADVLGYGYAFPNIESRGVTDNDGHYRLKDLTGPTTPLLLKHAPYDLETFDKIEVDRVQDFVLKGRGIIRGKVIDEDTRKPVTTFNIKIISGGIEVSRSTPGETFNSPDGAFVLKDIPRTGSMSFTVAAEGYLETVMSSVKAISQSDSTELAVILSKGKALQGIVVDAATNQPMPGLNVLFGIPGGSRHSVVWSEQVIGRDMVGFQKVVTDAEGHFSFKEGQLGTIYLFDKKHIPVVLYPEDRARFVDSSGLVRIALEPGATLHLIDSSTTGGDMTPGLAGLLDSAHGKRQWELNASHFQDAFFAEKGPDGQYLWEGLPSRQYNLSASASTAFGGYNLYKRLTLSTNEDKTVDLAQDMGPLKISGRILSPQGDMLTNGMLFLSPQFAWNCEFYLWTKDGSFSLSGLKPGAYFVHYEFSRRGLAEPRQVDLPPLVITASGTHDIVILDE